MRCVVALLLVLACCSARAEDALLRFDGPIQTEGRVGSLAIIGPGAFAIAVTRANDETLIPVAGAARWESGRLVAFAHDGFLNPARSNATVGRLLVSAADWCSRETPDVTIGVYRQPSLLAHLQAAQRNARVLASVSEEGLRGFKVIALNAHHLRTEDVPVLAQWVKAGGGLVTAATGWGWAQTHPEQSLAAHFPGNRLLIPAGMAWSSTIPKASPEGHVCAQKLKLPVEAGKFFNASWVLDTIVAYEQAVRDGRPGGAFGGDLLAQFVATVVHATASLPADDATFLPRLAALEPLPSARELPRPEQPLRSTKPAARILLTRDVAALARTAPQRTRPHPAAAFFPGSVPADTPRLGATELKIRSDAGGWQSTGLYAPPGELITLRLPAALAGKGFALRIGCHTDALWRHDNWKRVPEITTVTRIAGDTAWAANAFGGLIYIEGPQKHELREQTITIAGAVAAPRFVLGKTTAEEWARSRQAAAPWAELETSKIILTVPSEKIRTLEDPRPLLEFWDRVQDANADLIALPRERARPERIVADVQISVGYMHAGYPIMVPIDSSLDVALDLEKLKRGSWGHFHELGHNHQQPEWTFDGTVEVTCNLFSLYVCETLCDIEPGQGHDAMKPAARDARLRRYLAMGAPFAEWKKDPFLALTMYDQLRAGFGWETYKKVFAEYRALPNEQRPKTDDEKRDQWLTRFCRAAGRNLGPFFQAWGVPTSEQARAQVAELPAWMPADWPR